MYEKDLLQQLEPPCADADENGDCDNWDDRAHHTHVLHDAREPDPWPANVRKGQIAYLPHSCDEWIIGGPNEVRALIEDLQAIIKQWDA